MGSAFCGIVAKNVCMVKEINSCEMCLMPLMFIVVSFYIGHLASSLFQTPFPKRQDFDFAPVVGYCLLLVIRNDEPLAAGQDRRQFLQS